MAEEANDPTMGDVEALGASGAGELDVQFHVTRAAALHNLFGDDAEPVRLGRYTVLDTIGSGAMGTVYLAEDPELHRKLAIKLVRTDDGASKAHRRFLREAQALAMLNHPNVVTIHDVGQHRGQTFIAMEYVHGRTVATWQTERERTVDEILEVYVSAGRGLAAAHDKGLVHRDFKPANVLVADDGRIVVVDFGLARKADEMETTGSFKIRSGAKQDAMQLNLTRTGARVGTPAYMSLEQLLGRVPDARGDQFSFCAALYESLYRRRPFEAGTLEDLIASVRAGKIPAPPGESTVPPQIWHVLERGLSAQRNDRFESMDELLEVLDLARSHAPRRSRGGWVAVASVAAVVAGWAAWPRSSSPPSPMSTSAAAPEIARSSPAVRAPRAPLLQVAPLELRLPATVSAEPNSAPPQRKPKSRAKVKAESAAAATPTHTQVLASLERNVAKCDAVTEHEVQFQVLTSGKTAAARVQPGNTCIRAEVRATTFPARERPVVEKLRVGVKN